MTDKKSLFNLETVQALRDLSEPGQDFFVAMGELYLKQAPEQMSVIETSLNEREFKAVSDTAHQLKSSTGNLGAEALGRQFRVIEEAALAADLENLLRVMPVLRKDFAEVCSELKRIVEESKRAA